ncbi:MAG: hypothetical protein A2Y17_07075 [Clostridiales bacterium GWF2_38_85]|nr:MAG: hypothetical protein A2Y17_07075 [Clostridiales bacterium GWF2_38_85]
MPKANYQKIKLLKLMELFRHETDEEHPLKTSEVCVCLNKQNISCDRRTLGKDIAFLNEQGFEVMSVMRGHEKAYYIEDRSFSVPELKILIDAVQAASFITKKKTVELIDKIANLGGSYRAEILKGNMVCFNTRKHSNESIYYNVGFLEVAIQEKKTASFYYYDLNEQGEKVYRKKKERYIVEPMALVFNEDNYYLMCYSSKYNGVCNYRVDRMESVSIEDMSISSDAIMQEAGIANYTEQVFKMYGGHRVDVTLQFDYSLIGVVYDKFGENTKMVKINENTCVATVGVQISPTFWGWLFQFAGKMKILSPESIVMQYKSQVNIMINEVSE